MTRFLRTLIVLTSLGQFARALVAGDATFHEAPKPLATSAVTAAWPRFLGPNNNVTSPETHLLHEWAPGEPRMVWEVAKGAGHSSPAIADHRVVLFHRLDQREVADCFDAESGRSQWHFEYEAPYRDRYGAGEGTRTSPVADNGRVYLFGITGLLHCLDLQSGRVLWKRDLARDYAMAPNFFGHGSTPLVEGGRVILNIGGRDEVACLALEASSGKESWRARHAWGASYASPVPAEIHGRRCCLVFVGGESRPPTGGLLCLDIADGAVLNATAHRPRLAESVSASSPVVVGNRVFVTESYGAGGRMIEIKPDFSATTAWTAERFGCYFMTPLAEQGHLFGFDGQQPQLAELVCYEAATGKEKWRDDLGGQFQRGTLLAIDGAVLCLGENGTLAWLDLSPKGVKVRTAVSLFHAPETWTLPAVSSGLLYVCQDSPGDGGTKPRLICYDLRGR
jgi:outer membrane protein assembly factor BamB